MSNFFSFNLTVITAVLLRFSFNLDLTMQLLNWKFPVPSSRPAVTQKFTISWIIVIIKFHNNITMKHNQRIRNTTEHIQFSDTFNIIFHHWSTEFRVWLRKEAVWFVTLVLDDDSNISLPYTLNYVYFYLLITVWLLNITKPITFICTILCIFLFIDNNLPFKSD